MKLFFTQFRNAYQEFRVLDELSTTILEGMGIFLKKFTRTVKRNSDRLGDLESDDELEMTDGVYESRDQFDHL